MRNFAGTFRLQAPVGNRVPLRYRRHDKNGSIGLESLQGWTPHWFGSGTMALAAAIRIVCVDSNVGQPKVVVAAYGCPDVIAAIKFAGAEPVYVDLAEGQLRMDLAKLARSLENSEDVVAIIGMDLFGIAEDWTGLRQVVGSKSIALIQDCAQSLQPRGSYPDELRGDIAIFSFGRGKPAYATGGGAFVLNNTSKVTLSATVRNEFQSAGTYSRRFVSLRSVIYNLVLNPFAYTILARLMGERLGATEYVPLDELQVASSRFSEKMNGLVNEFWLTHCDKKDALESAIEPLLGEYPEQLKRLDYSNANRSGVRNLLRFPLLCADKSTRDKVVDALSNRGISATKMYGRSLPEIMRHATGELVSVSYPAASVVADTLFTLPLHNRMTTKDLRRIRSIIADCL